MSSYDDTNIDKLLGDAEKGEAEAQYNLGLCYKNGKGVESDPKQAVYWFEKAAINGCIEAMHEVADHCISRQLSENDIQEVFETFLSQMRFEYEYASLNDWEELAVESAYCIGIMILKGISYGQTNGLAHVFLREAAQRGHAMAQFSLGKMYLGGVSVKQNYSRALKWLTRAEQQGISQAKSLIDEINAIDDDLIDLDSDTEQMLESICLVEENGIARYCEPVKLTLVDGTQVEGFKRTYSSATHLISYNLQSYESVIKVIKALTILDWGICDYEEFQETHSEAGFDGFFDSDRDQIDQQSINLVISSGDREVTDFESGYRSFITLYWVYKNGMRKEIDQKYITESLESEDVTFGVVLDDEMEALYELLETYSRDDQ